MTKIPPTLVHHHCPIPGKGSPVTTVGNGVTSEKNAEPQDVPDEKPTTFLIDRGAAKSVLRAVNLPNNSFLSTIDVSCVGMDGVPRSSPLPDLLARFVVSSTCPLNLLGADVLSRLQASIRTRLKGG